ncbi:MAG TPA: HAD family phosphatase [Cellvibrionaceae bacterium]
MIRAIIFDHDGTLVDSERKHYQMWVSILADFGIDFTEYEYKTYLAGVPTRTNADYLVETYKLPISQDELFARREKLTHAAFSHGASPMIIGARELVQWTFARNLKMAIATGAARLEVKPTLDQYKLHDYFPIVATREDVQNVKPAPDVYLYAMQQLGLRACECIAIEDSPTGMQSALAAGLECVVVQNDYSRGHDFSCATVVVDSMQQARQWLIERL